MNKRARVCVCVRARRVHTTGDLRILGKASDINSLRKRTSFIISTRNRFVTESFSHGFALTQVAFYGQTSL